MQYTLVHGSQLPIVDCSTLRNAQWKIRRFTNATFDPVGEDDIVSALSKSTAAVIAAFESWLSVVWAQSNSAKSLAKQV
jgi:hypothetical protein